MRVDSRAIRRVALLGAAAIAACISTTTKGRVVPTSEPVVVVSPVRAYLLDGSIVVYPRGVSVASGVLRGEGERYTATLAGPVPSGPIPLDSLIGVETFERTVNPVRTLLYSAVMATGTVVLAAVAAVALFGSCPTIYADSAGTAVLEAESYSYSIAPLLESRDIDRLRVVADSTGTVRLEVRNEALETHYTDQVELIEVRHRPDEMVLPVAGGGYAAVRGTWTPPVVRDGAGRNVRAVVERADGVAFATDSELLRRAAEGGDSDDHIDFALAATPGHDSVAIVLRMRSSLLSTVLLYDHMLARPGARSLDWMARDLGTISTLAELATWYRESFGMRISVLDDGRYRQAARIANVGPAAWHDVAAVVPASDGDSVRIRLSFPADEWRIDRIAVASDVRGVEHRGIAPVRVVDGAGGSRPDALDFLSRADGRRLQTRPGQRYFLDFDVGRDIADESRTFLLAAQGYYVEWVRGSWLAGATDSTAFAPSRGTLASVLTEWRAQKDSLERTFFERRVPVVPEAR